MKQFSYTITDPVGIHARPAGLLVREAKAFLSTLTLTRGDQQVNLLKLMALMGLGVRCGETVTVTAEGPDEEEAAAALEAFFKSKL